MPSKSRSTSQQNKHMRRLLATLLCALTLSAQAAYVVAPEIVREYAELKAKSQENPSDAGISFEYAMCLSYMGEIERARASLKKVRKLDPKFPEKALPGYLTAYRDGLSDPRTAYRLGFLYYFLNDYEQALSIFSEVAHHRPVGQLNAWALGYMAAIKGEQNKWEEAEELVQEALKIEPDAYGLHAALAAALKHQGKLFAAMGEYFTSLRLRREFEDYAETQLP